MHIRQGLMAASAVAVLALAGCSSSSDDDASAAPSTSNTSAPATSDSAMAQECLPVPGDKLVVLADDQQLQNSDNLIPEIGAEFYDAQPAVAEALNVVSAALDTDQLIALNKAVDIDRQTSKDVAQQWVDDNALKAPSTGSGDVIVGAANFTENITVAEIYAVILRDAGYDVEVRDVGNRETYMPALISGEVNIVPEYAATAAEYFNIAANGDDAEPVASGDITETVTALTELGGDAGLKYAEPSAAQDQNAFAVTTAFADQYGVTSLSELASTCGPISLGGPPECPERAFCQLGLQDTYGLEFNDFQSLDAGGPLTKTAIQQGQVALGLVFSSDGSLG
ncbi:glycine betaine ABC transporter substrate-binding protein [Demequina aurantiaca]|uniref:glycine betaine ABC transporter substrate-binding protein n=1 Tax=Demequina aurantiaca TaxID=676200 RepID=UPI000AC54DCF|nr:glycine betaine ABC transporter substrate-binding protein [Demequina aurantiaca]